MRTVDLFLSKNQQLLKLRKCALAWTIIFYVYLDSLYSKGIFKTRLFNSDILKEKHDILDFLNAGQTVMV